MNPINIKQKFNRRLPDPIPVIKEVSLTQESPEKKPTNTISLERVMEVAQISQTKSNKFLMSCRQANNKSKFYSSYLDNKRH